MTTNLDYQLTKPISEEEAKKRRLFPLSIGCVLPEEGWILVNMARDMIAGNIPWAFVQTKFGVCVFRGGNFALVPRSYMKIADQISLMKLARVNDLSRLYASQHHE
jgi:hypothetical protein